MNKKIKIKVFSVSFLLILLLFFYFFFINFFKFDSIYFEKRWQYTRDKVEKKNFEIIEKQKNGKIFFENEEFKFLKISLEENGFTYEEDYFYRPLGYIDIFNDRIFFAHHDGTFYYSNKIEEIKKNGFKINKIKKTNFDFKFDIEDLDPYRSILIRDILIDKDDLYVVINGRNKINEDEFSFKPIVLKSKINLNKDELSFEKFFDPTEIITGSTDFSHSGGRLVKYSDDNFLLTVPDHALMDDHDLLIKRINSQNSIVGKILMFSQKNFEIFSYGHRNPQGLFYDADNDLVFQTEHGPTGGDEINLIKKGRHYGWPVATKGAFIKDLNKFRNHKKHGFQEPLAYWWPRNCGISEIIKIDEKFNRNWKNYNLLNACLSGSGANQGLSIYRWKFDKKRKKLEKKNQYYIGDRIRDMKYSKKHNTIFLVLENQKSIALIYK